MLRKPRKPTLRRCAECGSDAAALLAHEIIEDDDHPRNDWWRLVIRCGECGAQRVMRATQSACERWEHDTLDAYNLSMVKAADALARERFEAQAENFIAALHAGLIGPDDFYRQSS